jgi:hypothetical protein
MHGSLVPQNLHSSLVAAEQAGGRPRSPPSADPEVDQHYHVMKIPGLKVPDLNESGSHLQAQGEMLVRFAAVASAGSCLLLVCTTRKMRTHAHCVDFSWR